MLLGTQVNVDGAEGASRHVIALASYLASAGHAVTLLSPGRTSISGVRQPRIPRAVRAGAMCEVALSLRALSEIARERPDVAYVRISASTCLLPYVVTASRIPLVVELNGPILDELRRAHRPRVWVEAVRRSLRTVVRDARVVVAASENVKRHAEVELGAERVVVMLNGADLDVATPGPRDEARRELGLPMDLRLVSMVGSLGPEQRLDLVFEAMHAIDGVGLVIVGDGVQRDRVRDAVKNQDARRPVFWLGSRPHAEAILAERAADVCLNARDGDLGMKGLEYAAVGRRQVAFRMEGSERLASLYPGEEAMHLISDRTALGVRRAIEAALSAEERLGALLPDAVSRARSKLGWSHKGEALIALFQQVVELDA